MYARNLLASLASLALLALVGCGSGSSGTAPQAAPPAVSHAYNGTASVGDFLTLSVDATNHTLTYANHSNGDGGTLNYTVNSDGSYAISDPQGNLITAYEVPGYALVVQANKAGPNHATPALIIAVESGPISLSTFEGATYNYMQFRTTAGGVEAGSVSIASNGSASNSSYWPYGALNAGNSGQSPFNGSSIPLNLATADASGTFLSLTNGANTDTIFGTANGMFAVDTGAGTIFGLKQAASKAFDPSTAGTYHAIYYAKSNASTGTGNAEIGSPMLGSASVVVSAQGAITITDGSGSVLAQGTLAAVADTPYLYGASPSLANACFGLFTLRSTSGSVQQDLFVSFLGQTVIFASFSAQLPAVANETYNYFYGVGLTPQ